MVEGPARSRGPGPLCPPSSRGSGRGWAEKSDQGSREEPHSLESGVVGWASPWGWPGSEEEQGARLIWGLEWGEVPQGAQRELEPKAHARCSRVLTPGPKGRCGWNPGWTSLCVSVNKPEPPVSAELSSPCPFYCKGAR